MAARYRVRLKDQAGAVAAEFDHFLRLEYRREVNGPGFYGLTLPGTDARRQLFELDGQVEVLRADAAAGIPWGIDFEGLHRKAARILTAEGKRQFVSSGTSNIGLLARRIIAYYSETPGSRKTGAAESVMKLFVRENAGDLATLANGRVIDGQMPGLSIQADAAGGPAWQGARAWQNLLEVLQGIALTSDYAFDVLGVGPAQFEFRTYAGQRGSDRTIDGLNPATGLNLAGNSPVVFSVEGGTIRSAEFVEDRTAQATVALALGRGTADARSVRTQIDADLAASPWNHIEVSRNASNETSENGLDTTGERVLGENALIEMLDFEPVQVRGLMYGQDYTIGDRVTVRYDGLERNKEIVAVTIVVDESGETIRPEFADAARW